MAAGIDLRACIDEPLALQPQAAATMVPSGIAILINRPDVVAFVLARSGLGGRRGVILGQSVGTIDPDYTGPWLIPLVNRNALGTPPVTINPGDRIAQAVFVPLIRPTFRIVEEFSVATSRGGGGFGSTG
jgi:dUTP pyrophosphatase